MGASVTIIVMNKLLVGACLLGSAALGPLPIPGADGYGKQDGYFQYINVPKHKQYEWGYRRGNENHNREQYLSLKDHTFKSKLKWHDGYGGHGEHYFDFNHGGGYEEPVKYSEPPKYVPAAPPSYSS